MLKFTTSIHCEIGHDYGPLAVTFDVVLAALDRLPRMFIEPDGSFVWTGTTADGSPWQVDGNLIDQGDVLAYVELSGCCPAEQFDLLLGTLGWPAAALAFQLPRRGIYLNETEFRRLAASELGAV
jgi:hypothetical protein